MEAGCHTYAFRGLDRPRVLALLPVLGFRRLELWAGHAPFAEGIRRAGDIAAEIAAQGLEITAYSIGGLFGLPLAVVEERVARALAFARALGTAVVTGIADRAAVPRIDALAAREDMRFGLENHWYTEFARPADYAPVLADASPAIGVAIDTGHFAFLGLDLAAVARTLGPRAVDVHVKVVRPENGFARLLRRRARRFHMNPALPGPDDQLDRFLPALAATGYAGPLVVEHEDGEAPDAHALLYRARLAPLLADTAASPAEALHV